ncbi:hypothetical protein, partial [Schlesneria paludicola]|uniref:hypothetical protein n=1 Tax=Schlesneria paludicola TaxID=360056 RepID=UPI001ED95B2A
SWWSWHGREDGFLPRQKSLSPAPFVSPENERVGCGDIPQKRGRGIEGEDSYIELVFLRFNPSI